MWPHIKLMQINKKRTGTGISILDRHGIKENFLQLYFFKNSIGVSDSLVSYFLWLKFGQKYKAGFYRGNCSILAN